MKIIWRYLLREIVPRGTLRNQRREAPRNGLLLFPVSRSRIPKDSAFPFSKAYLLIKFNQMTLLLSFVGNR